MNHSMTIEIIELGQEFPNCSDRGCELDASVFIATNGEEKKPWCTGHTHCEISVWMVGL